MLTYSNKTILAPMVRVGTLPMRLLALDFGADIVYTEEIIDFRLLRSKKVENRILNTIDFIDEDQNIVFRTCSREKPYLVLQLGTASAERALRAAKMVEKYVSGIDINMGCPKEFSIKGGMGAALLSQPEKIHSILRTLIQGLSLPVTCKIRVLPEFNDTLRLVKLIEKTGVAALAVHGRIMIERPQHKNRNHIIKEISKALSIPVIANGGSGEISTYDDIAIFRQNTGCSSVMIARQAEWNCSIFRKEGKLPLDDIIHMYIKYAVEYDSNIFNTKYCIQQMLGSLQETDRGKILLSAQKIDVICELWNLKEFLEKTRIKHNSKEEHLKRLQEDIELQIPFKKRRIATVGVHEVDSKFEKCNYGIDTLPKSVLWRWAKHKNIEQPSYQTEQYEKSFQSIVSINGGKYTNCCLEKNKRSAEQAAALAACISLQLINTMNSEQLTSTNDVSNFKEETEHSILQCNQEKNMLPAR